jgi:hypothetical protein
LLLRWSGEGNKEEIGDGEGGEVTWRGRPCDRALVDACLSQSRNQLIGVATGWLCLRWEWSELIHDRFGEEEFR